MSIYELLFILCFFGFLIITLMKLFNIFSVGNFYDMKLAFIYFVSTFILYAVLFVIVLTNPEIIIYHALFNLCTWILRLNVLFMIIELFFYWKVKAIQPIRAKMSSSEMPAPMRR